MSDEKNETKYIKYDYVINEMTNDIEKSIENVKAVIEGQTELIDYLEKANNQKFKNFVEQLKKGNEQYTTQIKILSHRLDCIKTVKAMKDRFEEIDFALSMLLEAFGVVNKDAKTIEERANNKEEVKILKVKHTA